MNKKTLVEAAKLGVAAVLGAIAAGGSVFALVKKQPPTEEAEEKVIDVPVEKVETKKTK